MKRLLTIKGLIVLALVTTIVAGAAIYASHVNVDTNITGAVTVTTTGDAIQILSGDGVTPINSGGTVQFGTVAVDPFGRSPVPVVGPIFVINVSNGPVQVWITGDGGENIVPLFGPTQADLQPYPGNAFTLQPPGISGDTQSGYLGLSFQTISAGPKTTTIIFRATEVSLATLRDVNGDGKDDVIVGAQFADPGNKLNAGSAYVYSGADGSLLYQVDGASTGDHFGVSVSMAGDVNGDGVGDFIVGAVDADPGNKTNAGSAYVYSGADGSLLYQKNGGAAADQFGQSVSAAGDVNGDGKVDFIVGARLVDTGNKSNAGSAYVYSGADGSLLYQKYGGAVADQFGKSVSGGGDVNGDGKADFIVGAFAADPGAQTDAGKAYVYSGADGSLLYQVDGVTVFDNFGFSVSSAGDANGDGNDDFIVGARNADPGNRSNAGSAHVYSGADGSLLYQVDGASTGDNFGFSVSMAGDVNGDGKDDFIVGAPQAGPGGRSLAGSAYVYSGADGSLLYQVDGTAASDFLGYSVSAAGDVNGDGKDDFIVGAGFADPGNKTNAGSAYVYSGADGTVLYQLDGAAAGDSFGLSVGAPGSIIEEGQ